MAYCDEYIELISAAVDGALSQEELERLNAHLAQCPDCRALLADLTAIHEGLAALPDGSPPAGLREKIMSAVAADNTVPFPQKKKARSRKKWGALAAAAALVFAGAWGARDSILPGGDRSAAADLPAEAALEAPAEAEAAAESEEDGDRLTTYAVIGAGRTADSGPTDRSEAVTAGAEGSVRNKAAVPETAAADGGGNLAAEEAPAEAPLPAEAEASDAPRIAMFSAVPSSSATPKLYIPYDAAGEPGRPGAVLTRADAVTALANYMYEFVDQVELVDDGLNVNFAVNSPTGASGVVTCVDEDPEVFFLNYQDSEDTGVYRYSVVKADGSVNYLGREEAESAPEGS